MEGQGQREWYKSSTMQVNLGIFATTVGAFLNGQIDKETFVMAIVSAVANLILRVKTKGPIN